MSIALTGPGTVMLGGNSQYAATVTGSSNATVTWSVNGVSGGNSAVGSISKSGLYTAPMAAPQSSKIMITATSVASPSVSQSLPVALATPPPNTSPTVTLTLNGAASVALGTTSQYMATVTGTSNTAVTWSVDGVAGGNATAGTISADGLYTAPATAPPSSTITITATSMVDPSVSQSLAITLTAPSGNQGGPGVTLALSGATTVPLGTSSQYAATVTGTTDSGVAWSVNGVAGGDTTVGVITTKGLYTAPSSEPRSSKVTITATSLADASVSQSLAVTLTAPVTPKDGSGVTVTLSGATTVTLGASSQYTAIVTGSTNSSVTWSVDGIAGGDASVGSITTKGRYTAPKNAPNSSKVTITATSVADTSVSQSLIVTLAAPPKPPSGGNGGGSTVSLSLSGATTVTLGTTSQYSATVTGSTNTGVTWSVNGVTGGNAATGTISTGGLYAAPASAPQTSTVTITATSAAAPSVAKSLVTTLVSATTRIPSNAIASSDLDASPNWEWTHDPGTPGSSQGTTTYPVSGYSADNTARKFYMTYSGASGELYHVSFATDKTATHFVYDAYVYLTDPSQVANLEMDMNDVMTDGRTVILATQCSSYSNSWEYTLLTDGGFHWHPSNIPCSPKKWSANTWHHIQIASHRDGNGVATYDWVSVDGTYGDFDNASGADAKSLGWAIGDLLINFQIDGANKGSGSATIYTDKLIVYRW
ncbi:MAG TPA: hypothetical protein VGF82_03600 [Terracidiphilus sp.]